MFSGIKKLFYKACWAPIVVLLLHNGIAKLWGHKPSLDPAMHFLGGAAMAYFFYQALLIGHALFGDPKPFARSFIVFCAAVTVAVFWEFLEFIGGKTTGNSVQTSVEETMYDLLLGAGGALLYLCISAIIKRIKKY